MKRLFTLICTMLLGASLAFAQASAPSNDSTKPATETQKSKKANKKAKKGTAAKQKKGSSTESTSSPK